MHVKNSIIKMFTIRKIKSSLYHMIIIVLENSKVATAPSVSNFWHQLFIALLASCVPLHTAIPGSIQG